MIRVVVVCLFFCLLVLVECCIECCGCCGEIWWCDVGCDF